MLRVHSALAGRLRVSSVFLRRNPHLSAKIIPELRDLAGISSVSFNRLTGSLLVRYHPALVAVGRVVALIARHHRIANVIAFPVIKNREERVAISRGALRRVSPRSRSKALLGSTGNRVLQLLVEEVATLAVRALIKRVGRGLI